MAKVSGTKAILNSHLVEKSTKSALWKICLKIIDNMHKVGAVASGQTIKSLTIKTHATGGALYGFKSLIWMEKGRPAGGRPPFQAIEDWLNAKKIKPQGIKGKNLKEKRHSLAFLIANSIKSHGTQLHRMHGYNDIYTKTADREVNALAQRFILSAGSDIDALHKKFANINS